MFVPASTTKILTEGTFLAKLGADYRFHTRVYRTGSIDSKGHLKGDVILVASGDPNLSNRIQPDGTLAFVDEDHSYNGPARARRPLVGYPGNSPKMSPPRDSANRRPRATWTPAFSRRPSRRRHRRGDVFHHRQRQRHRSGRQARQQTRRSRQPRIFPANFLRQVRQSGRQPARQTPSPTSDLPNPRRNPDGPVVVTLSGSIPPARPHDLRLRCPFTDPFRADRFPRSALRRGHLHQDPKHAAASPDSAASEHFYTSQNQLAEHISLPLAEEIKLPSKSARISTPAWALISSARLLPKNSKDPIARRLRAGARLSARRQARSFRHLPRRRRGWRLGRPVQSRLHGPLPNLLDDAPRLSRVFQSAPNPRQRRNPGKDSDRESRRGSRLRKNGHLRLGRPREQQTHAQRQRPSGLRHHCRRTKTCLRRVREPCFASGRSRRRAVGCRASLGRNRRRRL